MPTRNVVLTDHHEKVIAALVESGRYQNASEVLREGLRMIEQREAMEAAKLKSIQAAAQVGFKDIDDGRFIDLADAELESVISDLGRQASANVLKPNH